MTRSHEKTFDSAHCPSPLPSPVHTVTRRGLLLLLVTALAGLVAACGEDDQSFALNGVYTISSWTENPDSCDAEGPDASDPNTPNLIVQRTSTNFFGQTVTTIVAGPCSDPQSCSNDANAGVFSGFGGMSVFEPGDKEGEAWVSQTWFASPDDMTMTCAGTININRLSSPAEGQVRLERESYMDLEWPYGSDPDFPCDNDSAIAAALDGATCTSLEVITADNPQDIPPPEEGN